MKNGIIKILNTLYSPLVMLTLGIAVHSVLPSDNLFLLTIRLLLGIFAFVYIPGYCLVTCFWERNGFRDFGFYLIFGFLYQLLNTYIFWWANLFLSFIHFTFSVYLLTITFVLILTLYSYRVKGKPLLLSGLRNCSGYTNRLLVIILVLYLIMSFHYQQYAPSPHSDGATYLDMARNVVKYGVFRSNMLFPKDSYGYVRFSSGRIDHFFGYTAISLFFMFGTISLLSAKTMLIFSGFLCIYLTYFISKILFNRRVALIATFLAAISPLMVSHVGLVGGPELPSLLFLLLTIYIIFSSQRDNGLIEMVIAGISMWISYRAWHFNAVVLLFMVPILFIYKCLTYTRFSIREFLLLLALMASLIIDRFFLSVIALHIFGFHLPTIFPIVFLTTFYLNRRRTNTMLYMFSIMLLAFYAISYTFKLSSIFLQPLKEYMSTVFPTRGLSSAAEASTITHLMRETIKFELFKTWNHYWSQVHNYIGSIILYLAALSIARVDRAKSVFAVLSFPLLHAILWCLYAQVHVQPRYLLMTPVFYSILAGSFLDFALLEVEKAVRNSKKIIIKFKHRRKIEVETRKIIAAGIFLIITCYLIIQINPIYDRCIDVLKGWDNKSKFGWGQAIEWIKNETSIDDVIMSRSANYFAWYTKRLVAWPPISSDANLIDFINAIRQHKAKYLIVDNRFYYVYPKLRGLYESPTEFLGAYPVFISVEGNRKVVIYNVTNIAYGELRREEVTITPCDQVEGLVPHPYYLRDGRVERDEVEKVEGNASVRITGTIKDVPAPCSVVILETRNLDLSNYDFLSFWIKAIDAYEIALVIACNSKNYYVYPRLSLSLSGWQRIVIPIKSYTSIYGKPNFSNIASIRIYVYGGKPGKTYTFWLDQVTAISEKYEIP